MTFPAALRDDSVSLAATQLVPTVEKIPDTIELLIEQCQQRARDAAAEESLTGASGAAYSSVVLGVDHTVVPVPPAFLVSVVVTVELRPTL